MGKTEKPPVDVQHICRYNDELITKLKDADWRERSSNGCLINPSNDIAYMTDFKLFEGTLDFGFNDYSEFFQLKKATYKDWKEVEVMPYDKYGINPERVIKVLRVLHGGYNAKIMNEVVLGFILGSTKPIIVFMPYKDDYAVFVVAPLIGDMELEPVTIDETIPFVEPVRVPFYYDLKTQTIGYSYNDEIVSATEFKKEWDIKYEEYEKRKAEPEGKIELKERVDALTQYFFGGFGNQLTIISAGLSILKEPAFPEEKKVEAEKMIRKSFLWIERKYEQIPFSREGRPYYSDFKPLFEINTLLPPLKKELEKDTLDFGKIEGLIGKIAELGKEYAKKVDKYYRELTGKGLGEENIETRALLEYRSKEQIQDQVSWLQEQDIKPNSFEKAAMDYYGVVIPEEEPPWRRLMDVIKELEKEHGLEVPEDIAIVAATEVGIEKPEDLIYELKRDGILYSPTKGLIARVEREKPIPFDWGDFIKDLEVKHYIGYRTEMAYGLGVRDLRSVVKYEIEELENTDIIDWTGVSDYIAMIDALYAHGYTEAVWLCKDEQHVIDYYCDGDSACPIEKYEITDGILLSDLGEDGQLVAYQPKKVKIAEEKEKPKEIAFMLPPTHLLDNPKKVAEWVSVQAQKFKDIASPRDLRARAWSEHVKATGLKPAMDAKDFYRIFDEQWEFGFKKSWQESQKEWGVKVPEEIAEEKWENITKEKLEETRRTSKFSEKYAVSQAKAAKKVSATEETVYEKLPDELDLGPYSEVLLYTPVEEIRYLSKAEHTAFIKLVDRGWFQVYRVSKPLSDKYPSGFTYMLKKTREEEKPPEKEILFYKYVKKELDEGAVVYTSYPTPVSEILIAQLPDGRWNVHPDPPLFPEKPFKTRTEALEYAETNMKTIIEEETGEKPEKIPEVLPPYELIKKERLSPEELEQLKKDIADLKRTREAWEKQLPGYEARQAIPELDRDIAEYEAKVRKEEAKAEIEKRIKPLKPLISEAEAAIDECDKGFETCLEFCDDDLEACYEECAEAKDVAKCKKKCEKEREKCHDKCETGATECYNDSAREIIEKDIEEGNLTKAEKDLETFRDYVSDELYEELEKRIKEKIEVIKLPEEVKPPIKPPEKVVPEKVKIHGILKTRYRCPICYRAAPDNFCMVHSDVEAIDLLAADEPGKEAVIDLTFLDLFKTEPEKKKWTFDELHEAIGIDIDYAPEFLAKPRIPETYAQYYARELGVEIEGVEKIVPPPPEKFEEVVAEEVREIEKRIEEREEIRDIKETIDLFIYRHREMTHPEEFLAHTGDVFALIPELPVTEREYYRKKLNGMITLAKDLIAAPKKLIIKPEEVDLIKRDYSKFLAEGNFPVAGFLDYVLSHRGERMSTAVVEILETLEEVGYDKEKIEIIRGWFT